MKRIRGDGEIFSSGHSIRLSVAARPAVNLFMARHQHVLYLWASHSARMQQSLMILYEASCAGFQYKQYPIKVVPLHRVHTCGLQLVRNEHA